MYIYTYIHIHISAEHLRVSRFNHVLFLRNDLSSIIYSFYYRYSYISYSIHSIIIIHYHSIIIQLSFNYHSIIILLSLFIYFIFDSFYYHYTLSFLRSISVSADFIMYHFYGTINHLIII